MPGLFSTLSRFFSIAQLTLVQFIQRNITSIRRSWLFSPATQPDAWKVIANRTDLYQSRVFKPKAIKHAEGHLPMVIMVHGGGFIFNNPSLDDPLARFLADNCGFIVVNIDYRKSPGYTFPAAYDDIVSTTLALLGDSGRDLAIDPSKVVLCGSSAGGNLVLAAAQDARLRGKLAGIVTLYPVVSLVPTAAEQMATRPDPSVPDFVGASGDMVKKVYTPALAPEAFYDPRISPTFFKNRDDLPGHIFMIGCEHDMLCHEAKVMAEKLADAAGSPRVQTTDGWQAGSLRWKYVRGQAHAFDQFPAKTKEAEEKRLREREATYRDIATWLTQLLG